MGLVLKYVERTASGSFQYRRRVPKAVAGIIGKAMFKQKLGDTRNEALAVYPRVHAQVEREIAEALRRLTLADAAAMPGSCHGQQAATEREAYEEAMRRRAEHVRWGMSPEDMELTGEAMLEGFLTGKAGIGAEDWQPVGVSPVDRHTVNLLRIGPDRYRPPEPTMRDALSLYIRERLGGENPDADQRPVMLAKRVVGAAIEALGRGDLLVSSLTREDARRVRDEMLDRLKATGRGRGEKVSPATVSRELSILAAVVNLAKIEFGLGNLNSQVCFLGTLRVALVVCPRPSTSHTSQTADGSCTDHEAGFAADQDRAQ